MTAERTTPDLHPVDALLAALEQGPANLRELGERTGYYAAAHLALIERARGQGYDITATHVDGITVYELTEEKEEESDDRDD